MNSSQLGTRGVVVGFRLLGRKSKLWILKEENLRCAGMGSGALPPTSVQVFRGLSNQPESQGWESPARKWAITMFTPQSTYHLWALLGLACYFSARPRPIGQLWRMVSAGCGTWRSLPSVVHVLSLLQSRSAPATLLCLVFFQVGGLLRFSHASIMTRLPRSHWDHFQGFPADLPHPFTAVGQRNKNVVDVPVIPEIFTWLSS